MTDSEQGKTHACIRCGNPWSDYCDVCWAAKEEDKEHSRSVGLSALKALGSMLRTAMRERDTARQAYQRQKEEALDMFAAVCEAHRERDEYKAKVAQMRDLLSDFMEDGCAYGDGCPSNAGTRHGTCTPCKVRELLEAVAP